MLTAIHKPTGSSVKIVDGPWYDFDKEEERDFDKYPRYGWRILLTEYEVQFPDGSKRDIDEQELVFTNHSEN